MRGVLWLGSVVVGVAAVLGASRLWAEDKEKKPAPRTRIGIVNLTFVIQQSDKYHQFQMEIKQLTQPFQEREAELRSKLRKLRYQVEDVQFFPAAAEDVDTKSKKEELEEKMKKIKSELEENSHKGKKKIAEKSDEQMRILYLDIYEVTQKYVAAHDLDLVLHYNDAITKEDFLSVQNIARKFNTGALMPLITNPNIDISRELVQMLNQKMHKK